MLTSMSRGLHGFSRFGAVFVSTFFLGFLLVLKAGSLLGVPKSLSGSTSTSSTIKDPFNVTRDLFYGMNLSVAQLSLSDE